MVSWILNNGHDPKFKSVHYLISITCENFTQNFLLYRIFSIFNRLKMTPLVLSRSNAIFDRTDPINKVVFVYKFCRFCWISNL